MNLKPDFYFKNVYEIDYTKLKCLGVDVLIFDIDNTLVTYDDIYPTEEVMNLFFDLKEKGFKIFLLSNNNERRVKLFAEYANIPYRARALKPLKFYIKFAIKKMGGNKKSVALIGDQLFTDVYGAKRYGICSVLVKPVSENNEDSFVSFKRNFEKYFLKKYNL